MSNLTPMKALAEKLIQSDEHEGNKLSKQVAEGASSFQALVDMRENASLVKSIYDAFPNLNSFTLGFYPFEREMDFFLSDVRVDGKPSKELEEKLEDLLGGNQGNTPEERKIEGALSSDGDILKFYDSLPREDSQGYRALLETTRDSIQNVHDGRNDINGLASELFPHAWKFHTKRLGLSDQRKENRTLTIFAETDSGPMIMVDVNETWLEKAERMAGVAAENQVEVSLPIYFWLAGDDEYESADHKADLVLVPRGNVEQAGIRFSAYEHDESNTPIHSHDIGLREIRQCIEDGATEFTVPYMRDDIPLEEAMEAFNLVRAESGQLVFADKPTLPRERG